MKGGMVFVSEFTEGEFNSLSALDCLFSFTAVSPVDGEGGGIGPGEVVVVSHLETSLGRIHAALEVDQGLRWDKAMGLVVSLAGTHKKQYTQDENDV